MTRVVALALVGLGVAACSPARALPPKVSLRLRGGTPDARVTIDDIVVGPFAIVAARGVAVPRGTHRITVEREGFFPWDKLVEATSAPVVVDVDLERLPD